MSPARAFISISASQSNLENASCPRLPDREMRILPAETPSGCWVESSGLVPLTLHFLACENLFKENPRTCLGSTPIYSKGNHQQVLGIAILQHRTRRGCLHGKQPCWVERVLNQEDLVLLATSCVTLGTFSNFPNLTFRILTHCKCYLLYRGIFCCEN